MNKKALELLKIVCQKQGEHNGRWRDEFDQKDSSSDYYEYMLTIYKSLKKQGLKLKDIETNPKKYKDPENNSLIYMLDSAGYELKKEIERYLTKIILS